eukprot:m51a1_g14609 putative cof1p (106) ;mRNA; r:1201424-1201829
MPVTIADEVMTAFNAVKYTDLVAALPKDSCRYAVYDLEDKAVVGSTSILVYILWTPTAAPGRVRMLSSSTDTTVRTALAGIRTVVQASDQATLNYDAVLQKARGN